MAATEEDVHANGHGRDPDDGETLTYIARPRSITAASRRIEPGNAADLAFVPKRPEKWQNEAWVDFDNVPEIKFAGRFNGNALSRLRMFPAIVTDPDSPPVPIQDAIGQDGITAKLAADALDETSRMGDSDSISQHLNEFGVNLTIPGDSYMVITPETPTEDETWQVYSESAVTKTDKGLALKSKPSARPEPFPPDTLAFRIWRRHSRWPGLADSNMRAILAEVEELLIYSRQFRAVGKSRNNAGLLFLHQDLDLPAVQRPGDPPNKLTNLEAGITTSMTTPTFDDSSASSVVPHIVRGRGKPDEMIKHFALDRKIDEQAIARVTFLIQRCAHGLDTPVEVLTGVADVNHWPCSEDTEVYTKNGWVTHDALQVGTVVLTLDHETGVSRWEPIDGVRRESVTDHPMIQIEGRSHSSLTTEDHRWPVIRSVAAGKRGQRVDDREWCVTADFATDGTVGQGRRRIVLGVPHAEIPSEPKHTDAFVQMCAWLSTDGDVTPDRGHRRSLRIRQRRTDGLAAIRKAIVGIEHSERRDELVDVTSFLLSADASERILPFGTIAGSRWIVSNDTVRDFTDGQLELFLATCEMANGGSAEHRSVFAVDPQRLAPIELAAILRGYRVTFRQRNQQHGFGTEPVWRCSWGIRREFTPRQQHMTSVSYSGVIFCPRVPVGRSFLARRNGTIFYTGNSAWQIEDQSYKMHLQPLAMVPAIGLARSFLRPALILRGNDPEVVARVIYALDSSALTVRPNRTIDAKDAFDRVAISWEAYRRHLGFSETEAPSQEELTLRATIGLGAFHRSGIAAPGETVPGLPEGGDNAAGGGAAEAAFHSIARLYGLVPEPKAITAAARDTTRRPTDLGQRLSMIDVRLRDRLQARASETMNTALRVAGNRLKQRVQGNAVMRAMVKGVGPANVVAALGTQQALTAAGGDGTGLLDGSFDECEWDFDLWTRQAQTQVVKLLHRYAPDEATGDVAVERFQQHQDANRDTAKAAFLAALMLLGTRRLFTPEGTPDLGEYNERLSVPAGLIREALSIAGGSSGPTRAPVDVPAATDLGEAGGIATGPDAFEAIAAIGVQVDAWEWQVGDPDRPFEPHQALDGVVFEGFDDPQLANDEPWPEDPFFFPGDHDGCLCVMVAITSTSEATV